MTNAAVLFLVLLLACVLGSVMCLALCITDAIASTHSQED